VLTLLPYYLIRPALIGQIFEGWLNKGQRNWPETKKWPSLEALYNTATYFDVIYC